MTPEEIQIEISTCKQLLAQTDYKALKHSEGLISDEEYEGTKGRREGWRRRINELERELEE